MCSLLSLSISNYRDIIDTKKDFLFEYRSTSSLFVEKIYKSSSYFLQKKSTLFKKYKTSPHTRNNYYQKYCINGQTANFSLINERKHRPKVSTLILLATTYVKKALRIKDSKTDLLSPQAIDKLSELPYTNYLFRRYLYSSPPRTFSKV